MHDRLEGDQTFACADWAEVSEDAIVYGYDIRADLVGAILVGEQSQHETDHAYAERIDAVETAEIDQKAEEFFRNEYGAELEDNGDYRDFSLTFPIEYGDAGARGRSLEELGDRIEKDTKLLEARNDYEYGSGMQSGLAAYLGYRWDHDTEQWVVRD